MNDDLTYYFNRAMDYYDKHNKVEIIFEYIKECLNNKSELAFVNGFYFSKQAYDLLTGKDLFFHINQHYDLTISDLLCMIEDAKDVCGAVENLFAEYRPYYAWSWAENFIDDLFNIGKQMGF